MEQELIPSDKVEVASIQKTSENFSPLEEENKDSQQSTLPQQLEQPVIMDEISDASPPSHTSMPEEVQQAHLPVKVTSKVSPPLPSQSPALIQPHPILQSPTIDSEIATINTSTQPQQVQQSQQQPNLRMYQSKTFIQPILSPAPPPLRQPVQQQPPLQPPHQKPPSPSSKLELNDAFAYLDKVKMEFYSQVDVYNRFLQIMREFKANSIDANGVIVRVVQLFRGHPALIEGFNAFLPKTHHIDSEVARTGILPPHLVLVATSMGINVSPAGIPLPSSPKSIENVIEHNLHQNSYYNNNRPLQHQQHQQHQQYQQYHSHQPPHHHHSISSIPVAPPIVSPSTNGYNTFNSGNISSTPINNISQFPFQGIQQHNLSAQPQQQAPQSGTGTPTASKKTNPQFVRAIGYVKKIKQRFSAQPEIYKSFLASLHSYHREQKSIFDVYMEVADLFNGNVDLLEEFVLFLPESEATSITTRLSQQQQEIQHINSGGRKRSSSISQQQQQQTPLLQTHQLLNPLLHEQQEVYQQQQQQQQLQQQPPLSKMSKRAKRAQRMISSSQKGAEEASFYEGVKRHLGDKQAYGEFLKCLNLFCQGIIKINDLLHLVRRFIGTNHDLFSWFKGYIGVKDSFTSSNDSSGNMSVAAADINGGSSSSKMIWRAADGSLLRHSDTLASGNGGELNIHSLKRFGSYRIYPKSHRLPKSSYRTEIGLETLQDSLVSCAVFPTEDSTFIASKKNPYEEALFKCEDERFEMDLLIDGNQAAIAVLEPLLLRLERMSKNQLKEFVFDSKKWFGTSEILYQKAIRKVYGDRTDEVLKGLEERPSLAVPVILKRLKAKDEEWRRVQRDWNRVWRDVHLRNYYKALDHQGLEIRNADKRSINGRVLIQECLKGTGGLEYCFGNSLKSSSTASTNLSIIIKDLLKLLKSVVKESGFINNGSLSNWGSMDRKAVMRFLATFLPSFLLTGGTTATSDNVLLFANNNLYVLVRLLQIAIERLQKINFASAQSAGLPFIEEKLSVVKSFFGAHEHPVDSLGFPLSSIEGNGNYNSSGTLHTFYDMMLVLLKQVIRNELDPVTFEERVRFMFGTSAYHVFTMDKLLVSIVKQVHSVLQDSCCEQLIRLFDNWNCDRSNQNIPIIRGSEYGARMAVESVIPSTPKEGIFRIEWNPSTACLSILKLERLSNSINASSSANQIDESGSSSQWSDYINKFIAGGNVVENSKKTNCKVFLKRCKRPFMNEDNIIIQYNLECKIALNTYKLFYVEHTEDFLYRL